MNELEKLKERIEKANGKSHDKQADDFFFILNDTIRLCEIYREIAIGVGADPQLMHRGYIDQEASSQFNAKKEEK